MANGGEDSRSLQEFRRNFGKSREHAPMPESYLRELERLVGAASRGQSRSTGRRLMRN